MRPHFSKCVIRCSRRLIAIPLAREGLIRGSKSGSWAEFVIVVHLLIKHICKVLKENQYIKSSIVYGLTKKMESFTWPRGKRLIYAKLLENLAPLIVRYFVFEQCCESLNCMHKANLINWQNSTKFISSIFKAVSCIFINVCLLSSLSLYFFLLKIGYKKNTKRAFSSKWLYEFRFFISQFLRM